MSVSAPRADTPLHRFVAVALFPLVMGGTLIGGAIWIDGGGDPSLVTGPGILAAGLIVLLFERLTPLHRSWMHSKGDLGQDLLYAFLVSPLAAVLTAPIIATLGASALTALSDWIGATVWPSHWPLLAQLPMALVVAEFPKYWHHRLQHETDLLWRFHALHHSAPRLYWLNAARFHPIDLAIDGIIGGTVLAALGCGGDLIALFTVTSAVHGFFQHANVRLRLGPLNYVFSMAELHRWHHSKTLEEANHNYGQNVIFWDLVFGTFYWPRDREPPEDIGIPDLPGFPGGFVQQLASPFRWARVKGAGAPIDDVLLRS